MCDRCAITFMDRGRHPRCPFCKQPGPASRDAAQQLLARHVAIGDPRAMYSFAMLLGMSELHDRKPEMMKYLDVLASRGYAEAMAAKAIEEWDRGFTAAGTESMKRAADAGLGRAHVLLGDCYANGEHGFERSLAQAVPWYRLAAKLGDSTALAKLGACAYNGTGGVAQDYAEAAKLYVRAAEAGNAQAMYFLAEMHNKGLGVEQDMGKSVQYLQDAAAEGHTEAAKMLEVMGGLE